MQHLKATKGHNKQHWKLDFMSIQRMIKTLFYNYQILSFFDM